MMYTVSCIHAVFTNIFSICDQASSIFFFPADAALVLKYCFSTVLCCIFCLTSCYNSYDIYWQSLSSPRTQMRKVKRSSHCRWMSTFVTLLTTLHSKESWSKLEFYYTRCSAIEKKLRCRVHYFWLKVENWNWKTIFYEQIYLQPLWRNRPAKLSNSVKRRKIRDIVQFSDIQSHQGRYQSKARMRLPIRD